ncbi:MAG: hypothetical protein F4Z04_00760 [Acidobacteria bacterium]|nr:hypothetical protein [Acidobacteriota bacterium]
MYTITLLAGEPFPVERKPSSFSSNLCNNSHITAVSSVTAREDRERLGTKALLKRAILSRGGMEKTPDEEVAG